MKRAVALAALLLTAACGTRVGLSEQTRAQANADSGLGLTGPTTDATSGPTTGPIGSGGTDTGTTSGSDATSAPTDAAQPTSLQTTGDGAVIPSSKPMKIAVYYPKGVTELAASFGISGLSIGDAGAQARSMVTWVNAHGGLGGRQVQLVDYGQSTSTNSDPSTQQAAACAAFRDDYKVEFVVTYINVTSGFLQCLAKANIGVIDDQAGLPSEEESKYASTFSSPGDMALGRRLTLSVDAMWNTGWLTKTSKVAAFSFDLPATAAAVKAYLVPALAKHGLKLVASASVGQNLDAISGASAAVIKFRSAGVDTVIPTDASPLFFMNAAQNQGYHPHYLVASTFGPGALFEQSAPKAQLVGSAGFGWQPYLDIGKGKRPVPVSANETLCHQLIRAAGEDSTNPVTTGLQLNLCNAVLYLKAAADKLPGVSSGLLGKVRTLIGTTFRPADTFRSDVSKRADGVAAYRVSLFKDDCQCYQYTGNLVAVP